MAEKKKENPPTDDEVPDLDQVTLTQLHNTLVNFITETRTNFSATNGDGDHDYELLQTINQNVVNMSGKLENVANLLKRVSDQMKVDSQQTRETVQTKVDEIKEEVAPKKIIVKQVPHFSLKLWFRSHFPLFFRR